MGGGEGMAEKQKTDDFDIETFVFIGFLFEMVKDTVELGISIC